MPIANIMGCSGSSGIREDMPAASPEEPSLALPDGGSDGGSEGAPNAPGADAAAPDAAIDGTVSPTTAHAIDFDTTAPNTAVNSQFPGVTFSTPATLGEGVRTMGFGSLCATSPPNTLQIGPAGVFSSPLTLDFTKPASDVKFRIGCIQGGGEPMVTVRVTMVGTAPVEVPITATGYVMQVDLSMYQQVTRLELHDIHDPAGLAFDDFTFRE